MIKLVIFDLDGTLLDSREKYYECMAYVLRNYGSREEIFKILRKTFGTSGTETMRILGVGEGEIDGLMAEICDYIEHSPIRAKLFPGVEEMLDRLRKRCKIAVATSRSGSEIAADADLAPLLAYMDVVSATDAGMAPKPAPDVLLKTLELLGIAPQEAVYVGDTKSDMACALSAGVRFVLAGWNPDALEAVQPEGGASVCLDISDLEKYI